MTLDVRLNRLEQALAGTKQSEHASDAYYRRQIELRQRKAELLSAVTMKQYRLCPKCGARVEKISGYCGQPCMPDATLIGQLRPCDMPLWPANVLRVWSANQRLRPYRHVHRPRPWRRLCAADRASVACARGRHACSRSLRSPVNTGVRSTTARYKGRSAVGDATAAVSAVPPDERQDDTRQPYG